MGQRTCRRTTLTAGDKWARLSGISWTTGPVCGAVGYDANSGSVIGTRRPGARQNWPPGYGGREASRSSPANAGELARTATRSASTRPPDGLANRCELRVLDHDPHADAVPWPGPSVTSITQPIDMGPFEDAEPCRTVILRRHAIIGAAEGLVLAVACDVGVCPGWKRLDGYTVQYRTDGSAPAIGVP